MLLTLLISAAMETSLNALLFRDRSLQSARQRLAGKTLQIRLQELGSPLTLLFSERQVDIFGQWEGEVDCTLTTRLAVLPQLRDRQQLVCLIRTSDLTVDGDIQVIQQFVTLLDLAEWDPAEWLTPYIGDVAVEGISRIVRQGADFIQHCWRRDCRYLASALVEEWWLAPGVLEVLSFNDQVEDVASRLDAFSIRLDKMERQ